MLSVGIDSGSVAVKGVLMEDDELLYIICEPAATDVRSQCCAMIGTLRNVLPARTDASVCVTGYGRETAGDEYDTISEIFANALGAGWAWRSWNEMDDIGQRFHGRPLPRKRPDKFRTVIDVGGQDSKVITFGADGVLEGFAMNDRCAAGTGRFLQELSVVLELNDVAELDALALEEDDFVQISSACTVFAESEVVSMVSHGVSRAAIAGGVFRSVAERTVELAESLQWKPPVFFDGGTAHLDSLRIALERRMGASVAVPACPQHMTAIGAAVHAAAIAG